MMNKNREVVMKSIAGKEAMLEKLIEASQQADEDNTDYGRQFKDFIERQAEELSLEIAELTTLLKS